MAAGSDPSENRKAVKAAKKGSSANSFEVISRELISTHMAELSESHRSRVLRRLEVYLFPWVGSKPITDITAQDILV